MKHGLAFCFLLLAAAAPAAATDLPDLASHPIGAWGVDLGDQDRSIKPGDDFSMYQNGGWYARTELGPDRPNAAYWRDLRQLAPRRLVATLKEIANTDSKSGIEAKAAAFWHAAIDLPAIDARGILPLKPELDAIRAVRTKSQMAKLMGTIAGPRTFDTSAKAVIPGRALFILTIAQDANDPLRNAVYVGQGGLLLPGPEYYSDPKLADYKAGYQAYVARVLTLIGWPHAAERAADVVDFESRLAAVSWSHEAMGDVVKTNNPMAVAALAKFAPGFDWASFFAGAGLSKTRAVIVDAKSAFPKLAAVFAATPLSVLQARMAFDAADYGSARLSRPIREAANDFRGKMFRTGFTDDAARDVAAEQILETCVPDILAALYVRRYSSPQVKAKAEEMAQAMRRALDARLQTLAWMDPPSRALARSKLARLQINIGYPQRFQDYAALAIAPDDLYGDVARAAAYAWRRRVASLDRPVDRSEWQTAPEYPQYNYLVTRNALEISAAMFQPPFFDLRADDAVNYGAVGAVIGQTMLTAFDNQGGQFDAAGRLRPWRSAEDERRLAAMTAALSAQYSAVEPLPGLHLKGELVVNEALDDIGGLQIALDAYHASLKGRPAPVLDGYTGDQRFFLGRAQMWRAKFGVEMQRNQIATGSNSPPFQRINGPLRNMDAWYAAFGVKPGDKLYLAPEDRVPFVGP